MRRHNPLSFQVNVTADWQEATFPFIAQVVVLCNVSAVGGTIRFKVTDDTVMGVAAAAGAPLTLGSPLAQRVIDFAQIERVLFRSDDAGQVIYIEAWR